ncbi:MAG: 30S ribosomal protein S20 [Candidatus Magasanikbacteria bacterium]|jgi:small subunit ribosomal protein S20|nr:30S ribosomal protein S20 [Candidatus Magasanikbacteria bacterium]MBT4071447.1 30S ribosomal protein S20 [Candidatus Magasanikbacteria bacterium]
MPNKNSAKKALRQSIKRAAANKEIKLAYKQAVKAAKKAIDAKEEGVNTKIQFAQKKLDKAAKNGVIKKNTASRKLSRLMKKAEKATK